MIKGIDMQVMTNRTAEYAKDVSQQLKQAEHMHDAAQQTQRTDVQREAESVVPSSRAEGTRVRARDEKKEPREGKKRGAKQTGEAAPELLLSQEPLADEEMNQMPNVGYEKDTLLDIEI